MHSPADTVDHSSFAASARFTAHPCHRVSALRRHAQWHACSCKQFAFKLSDGLCYAGHLDERIKRQPAAKELVLKSYFGTPHTDADDMTFSIVCQVPAVSFLRRLLHALCGRLVDCRRKALLAVLSQLARDGRCCWQAAARLPLTSLALNQAQLRRANVRLTMLPTGLQVCSVSASAGLLTSSLRVTPLEGGQWLVHEHICPLGTIQRALALYPMRSASACCAGAAAEQHLCTVRS